MALEIKIAAPCNEKWEGMARVKAPGGPDNDRQRHCASCKLNVWNVKELTEAEVRELLLKAEGRVCGRVYRRADGTVITKDCPTGVRALRKRAMAALMMTAALVLGVIGLRIGNKRECATGESDSWFDRTVGARFHEVREELRDTKTFGPLINEFWPNPVMVTAGAMIALPPPTPTPTPAPVPAPAPEDSL